MNILVSTSLSFMLIDTEDGSYRKIDTDRGLYYGISYSNDLIYVGARNSPVGSTEEREREQGVIILYDFEMNELGLLIPPFPLRDIHQIQFHQNKLYVTCTFDNKIAIFDGKKWHEFFPDLNVKEDFNHFNSIFLDDKYLYLTAHNLNRPSEIWKFKKPSIIDLMMSTIKQNQIFLTKLDKFSLGLQSHNIWIDDDEFFTCSSAEHSIVSSLGFSYRIGGFTRGLAVTDNYIFVGISELAERKDRMFTTSSIVVLSKHWEFIKRIEMPQEGMIMEIRVPGYKDYCSPYYKGKSPSFLNNELPRLKFTVYDDIDKENSFIITRRNKNVIPFVQVRMPEEYEEGWHTPDIQSGLVWTKGTAIFPLYLFPKSYAYRLLLLNCAPFEITVTVSVGQQVTLNFDIPSGKEQEVIIKGRGDVRLSCQSWSPADIGLSSDNRHLGIAVRSIELLTEKD